MMIGSTTILKKMMMTRVNAMTREDATRCLKHMLEMMTVEPPENLKVERDVKEWECEHSKIRDTLELSLSVLENQIPKKPMEIITDDNEFICMICPSCQEIAVEFNDRFCRRCGQALDWSEEEENSL